MKFIFFFFSCFAAENKFKNIYIFHTQKKMWTVYTYLRYKYLTKPIHLSKIDVWVYTILSVRVFPSKRVSTSCTCEFAVIHLITTFNVSPCSCKICITKYYKIIFCYTCPPHCSALQYNGRCSVYACSHAYVCMHLFERECLAHVRLHIRLSPWPSLLIN